MHLTKADVLKELLTKDFAHIPGLGVDRHNTYKTRTDIPRACLGEVVNKPAPELQELGVLSNRPSNVVQMEESVEYPNTMSELT